MTDGAPRRGWYAEEATNILRDGGTEKDLLRASVFAQLEVAAAIDRLREKVVYL